MARTATPHAELYDMLLDCADLAIDIEEMVLGHHWTLCRAGRLGLAPAVSGLERIPSWQGPLRGRQLSQLAGWLTDWDRTRAAIGLAVVNAALNREADIVTANGAIFKGSAAMRNSIDWFLPMLRGRRVALLGPKVDAFTAHQEQFELEHFGDSDGGIHPACDSVLPQCDWTFINARAIADKSLPQLLARAGDSRVVLYGAAVPWLDEWHHFGVDYLLGCEIDDAPQCQTAVSEGQDVEQCAAALHFRLINLQPAFTVLPTTAQPALRRVASS